MLDQESGNTGAFLQLIPSIDSILQTETAHSIRREAGINHLTMLARHAVNSVRDELLANVPAGAEDDYSRVKLSGRVEAALNRLWSREKNLRLKRVINATGVIIHTNLGRAPLSIQARTAIAAEAAGYCALEYDLETGKRGRRGAAAESMLAELTGAESALIVNNCAAAAILVLSALGSGGEAIISRGEMVEIGGDFRIPDVMTQSGAKLVEVGTTNRTRAADYERALTENTRLLVKVHPSNYRIVGFTASPAIGELAALAHRNGVLLYEDAGSGVIADLNKFGLEAEPDIRKSIADGADVVTFSGDKLLGGPQSGLIAGKHEVVERLRRHPLYRALRANKIIYAALEATFGSFFREKQMDEIPVLRMISLTPADLETRTNRFSERLATKIVGASGLSFIIKDGNSVIGGGSAPAVQPPTKLLTLAHAELSAPNLEAALRLSDPPVITRIVDDSVVIDLRTVSEEQEPELIAALSRIGREAKRAART